MSRSWGKLRRSMNSSSRPKSMFLPSSSREGNLDITGDSGVSELSTDLSPTDQSVDQLNICKFFRLLDFF